MLNNLNKNSEYLQCFCSDIQFRRDHPCFLTTKSVFALELRRRACLFLGTELSHGSSELPWESQVPGSEQWEDIHLYSLKTPKGTLSLSSLSCNVKNQIIKPITK